MSLSVGEIAILVIVMVIIFSASRMSALGNALGKFVHSFKKASQGDGFIDVKPKTLSRIEPEDAQVVDRKKRS